MSIVDELATPGLYYFNAVKPGTVTMVGFGSKDYPLDRGNCFHVVAEDGQDYQIVNFWYENLMEALRRGTSDDPWAPGVQWPIRCRAIRLVSNGVGLALIHDIRIPTDWYATHWCEGCCPLEHLPRPRQLAKILKRESGEEVVKQVGNIFITENRGDRKVRLPGA